MKDQRHKRKEVFSVLLVSNLDNRSRQLRVSAFMLRCLCAAVLLVCVLAVCAVGWAAGSVSGQSGLKERLAKQEEQVSQLEAEKEALQAEVSALAKEQEEWLRQQEALEQTLEEEKTKTAEAETKEEEPDSSLPRLYPCDGANVLVSMFSEEQPYLAISTYVGGGIVATGDGTILAVDSDDTYEHIIEIQHAGEYITRYLCREEAELKVEEGAQIQAGELLLTVAEDETQLDYQVIYEGEAVDPLSVIDAKG